MASKKKVTKPVEQSEVTEIIEENTESIQENTQESIQETAPEVKTPAKNVEKPKKAEKEPKYKVGSIVFVSRDAEADLNGFKLFPQYKKYTYTVEAYDSISDVYTLRRLNLSLRLKEAFILAPDEKAHDELNRKQF